MKKLLYKIFIKWFLKIQHPNDVILVRKDGTLLIGGKIIQGDNLLGIQEKATLLRKNYLLKQILNTIRANSESQIMYKGTDLESIHNNRMALFVVDQIEMMLSMLENYSKTIKKRDEFLGNNSQDMV